MSIKNLTFDKIDLTDGFWAERQALIRKTTIHNVYKRFKETGRFDALKLNWKEGDPNKPHIFWDSDVAKWVEGVAYLTLKKREPELEAIVDEVVDDIEKGRMADGYFNSCYQQFRRPEERFTVRRDHELYCAGHLLEGAIAYDMATGKGKFLSLMKDYMLYIKKRFMDDCDTAFKTPGHEEIELALVKLYDYTGEKVWLDMALWFIDNRFCTDEECGHTYRSAYSQAHLPVREQFTAEGHSVRAVYLYCAMADIAERIGDEGLKNACEQLFDNIVNEKMYITGAIGSTHDGEAFEEDYNLPNATAYAETCAALGLALYARRMNRLGVDSKFADTVERVIYNGFLSGMSLDGKSFFYENVQEIDLYQREFIKNWHPSPLGALHLPITQRVEVFSCSCCPPNITRFIPSIADFIYSYDADTVYINQYMANSAELDGIKLSMATSFPYDGKVTFKLCGGDRKVAFRIPEWCRMWSLKKNGVKICAEVVNGYAYADAACCDEFELELKMEIRAVRASAHIMCNRGMKAVTYGPFVMCMEGVDNGGWLGSVRLLGNYRLGFDDELNVPTVTCDAVREEPVSTYSDCIVSEPFTAKLIPYFTFANRGETDMRIWIQA